MRRSSCSTPSIPYRVIASFEVPSAESDAVGGDLVVELMSGEGPREVVSGTRDLTLKATHALDAAKPGLELA
jgi:hypothetical protein